MNCDALKLDSEQLGRIIRYIRQSKDISDSQVSQQLGYGSSNLYKMIEQGKYELSYLTALKIASILGVEVSEFTKDTWLKALWTRKQKGVTRKQIKNEIWTGHVFIGKNRYLNEAHDYDFRSDETRHKHLFSKTKTGRGWFLIYDEEFGMGDLNEHTLQEIQEEARAEGLIEEYIVFAFDFPLLPSNVTPVKFQFNGDGSDDQ